MSFKYFWSELTLKNNALIVESTKMTITVASFKTQMEKAYEAGKKEAIGTQETKAEEEKEPDVDLVKTKQLMDVLTAAGFHPLEAANNKMLAFAGGEFLKGEIGIEDLKGIVKKVKMFNDAKDIAK